MLSWMQLARKIEGASRTSEKARLFADALRAADPDILVDTLEDSDPILALFDGESE